MRRLLFFAAVLLAVACRKEPDRPAKAAPPPPPAPEIAKVVREARPVIFVAIDGVDWKAMPSLAALAREGRNGELTLIHPPLAPLVWTTMMTGVSPLEHGILDSNRRDPATGDLEPITAAERRVPAVWNMATEGAKSSAVFGFWATSPAEAVKGLVVSDRFDSPGGVYPPDQEGWAKETLEKTEEALGYEALHAFLPELKEEEYEAAVGEANEAEPNPVSALRRFLVETRTVHALATSWLERERPDLAVVAFRGLGGNPSCAAEIDRLLGEYRKLAETRGAVLMVVGKEGDQGRYLLWGPGIEKAARPEHGEAEQVAPTLLALLGLPPGRGLDGPPLKGTESLNTPPADYRSHFHPAAPEDNRTAASYDNEGLLRRGRGETDAASQAFEEALKIDPKNGSALWNLSDLLHSGNRDLDRSDDLLIQSLEAGLPQGVDYAMGRTVAYARSGDAPRGLKLLDRALTVRPKEPRLHLLRGRYRLERRQCEKALGDFENAARFDPKNALAFTSMGIAQLCVGDGDGASQSFRRSLKIDPNQPEIRRALRQAGAR